MKVLYFYPNDISFLCGFLFIKKLLFESLGLTPDRPYLCLAGFRGEQELPIRKSSAART
jgi:hypothetical protein